MRRKNIYILTIIFITSILFSTCSDDVIVNNYALAPEINFSISFNNKENTRLTTDSFFKTFFEKGDTIGIFIYKRNAEEKSCIKDNEIYVNNKNIIYDGSSWKMDTAIYHTNDGTVLDFYAYYPYREGATAQAINYDAETEMVDLLVASALGINRTNEQTVTLLFEHLLSLIDIKIIKDDGLPEFDNLLSVFFHGVTGGIYNLSTKEISSTTEGLANMLIVGEEDTHERVYRAWIPEQKIDSLMPIFTFAQTNLGKEFNLRKKVSKSTTFSRGEVTKYQGILSSDIEKDPIYNIYDPYPKYGKPVGMVVDVTNGGRNGTVISIKDAGSAQWSVKTEPSGATDNFDGINNTMKIHGLNNWRNDYPAFNLVASNFGEGWYIPPLELAYEYMRYKVDELNKYLENIEDYEYIDTRATYWTSTETSESYVHKVYVWIGSTTPEHKSNSYKIRAFFQF